MISMKWPQFIENTRKFSLKTRCIELADRYILNSWDEITHIQCELLKDSRDCTVFEESFKSGFDSIPVFVANSFSSAQTNQVMWNTSPGKRMVVQSFNVSIRNTTLTQQTLQVFNESNNAPLRLLDEAISAGGEKFIRNDSPYISESAEHKLRITFTGSMQVSGRFWVYEVF